ncbi:hypothetical protein, partial [Achromobacter sp. 2789STDY5608615]|uniref:hypothetical protein n=1 Tax=Achromobacter sp. 2789STDY5608615 TaxID=1806492 RepID=UPI001E52DC82
PWQAPAGMVMIAATTAAAGGQDGEAQDRDGESGREREGRRVTHGGGASSSVVAADHREPLTQ